MEHHHLPRRVGPGGRSVALLTFQPPEHLVVFVHGFQGHAISSWRQFDSMLSKETRCQSSDIVFYGYDGTRAYARTSGILLAGFLQYLVGPSADRADESAEQGFPERGEYRYRTLTIVAHSLGAVVARFALLGLSAEPRDIPAEGAIRLILFAPAHNGTRVVPFALAGLRGIPFGNPLGALAMMLLPPLQDIREGSDTLKSLATDTLAAIEQGAQYLVARQIVWGERDFVVVNRTFCTDPAGSVLALRNHWSVCKPTATSLEPIQEVVRIL